MPTTSTPTSTTLQTKQQERATDAWKRVNEVDNAPSGRAEYKSLVRGLAAAIQRDGLAPTLAFLDAKGKTEHKLLANHVSEWVLKELKAAPTEKSLLEWVIQQDSIIYRRAVVETQAYLIWLKRFAEAKGWE